MTNPTNATDAVQRVRGNIEGRHDWEDVSVDVSVLRILLARLADVEAEREALLADKARLLEAINWACGTREGFDPPFNAGCRYWWRSELVRRAGLAYNAEQTSYIDAARNTEGTR